MGVPTGQYYVNSILYVSFPHKSCVPDGTVSMHRSYFCYIFILMHITVIYIYILYILYIKGPLKALLKAPLRGRNRATRCANIQKSDFYLILRVNP